MPYKLYVGNMGSTFATGLKWANSMFTIKGLYVFRSMGSSWVCSEF